MKIVKKFLKKIGEVIFWGSYALIYVAFIKLWMLVNGKPQSYKEKYSRVN